MLRYTLGASQRHRDGDNDAQNVPVECDGAMLKGSTVGAISHSSPYEHGSKTTNSTSASDVLVLELRKTRKIVYGE